MDDATPVNAGIADYISIDDVVESLFDQLDWRPESIEYLEDRPVGVRHRAADTTRARRLLSWEPEYTIEEGLAATVEWYTKTRDEDHLRENLETLLHER